MPTPCNLGQVKAGQRVLVIGLEGGRSATTRLESLGLIPGTELEVISSSTCGPLLIGFDGGRMMVERGIAEKVQVA